MGPASNPGVFPARILQTSSGSWNSDVGCAPANVAVTDITAGLTGTNSFSSSSYSPGITENPAVSGSAGAKRWLTTGATPTGWVSPGPSCTITNSHGQTVASFVEIDNVRITSAYFTETDCSSTYDAVNGGATYASGGKKCDVTANIYSSSTNSCTSASDPGCASRIHTEIDQDWQGSGYCGPSTVCDPTQAQSQIVAQSTFIDIQGFVFWDPAHVTEQWHSYSGWELHPLTAWRLHQSSTQPDFSISSSPSSITTVPGTSATSTISLTSSNGFAGTVALSASVTPSGPAVSLSPAGPTLSSGGSASSTLSISVGSTVAQGTYSITVIGTSGSLSHSTLVSLIVRGPGDFTISATPSSFSIDQGSSAPSTITLTSVNGFSGTVTLGATVTPGGPGLALKPTSLSLSSGASASSTLTISAASTVAPGSYSVTVTGTSGSLSHSKLITLTIKTIGDFSISTNPSSVTVAAGGSGSTTVSIASLAGFSGNVSLSATASAGRLRVNLSPTNVFVSAGGSASGTLTVSPRIKLPPGSYTVTVDAKSGTLSHSVTMSVTVT